MAVVHFAVLSSIGTDGDGSRLPQVCLDFPHVEGPGTPTGNTTHVSFRRPGDLLLSGDLTEYQIEIVTEGIRSMGAAMISNLSNPLQCAAAICTADESLGPAIHTSAHSRVLAAWGDSYADPVGGYESWLPGAVISAARWTQYRTALLALGAVAATVDAWRTNHPDATPAQLWGALSNVTTAMNRPAVG